MRQYDFIGIKKYGRLRLLRTRPKEESCEHDIGTQPVNCRMTRHTPILHSVVFICNMVGGENLRT